MNRSLPKLYSELASWWPLLSAPQDYEEEAGFYRDILNEACRPREVLELGSGGGNNAFHMKTAFRLTLVDCSEEMLTVSRKLNPECEHHPGDMRQIRLGRPFDAVFVHDAVMYMTSEEDLKRAIQTAFDHCADGGVALLVPDCVRETFVEATRNGGHNGSGRSLRYFAWTYDPDPSDDTYTMDFAIMLREGSGSARTVLDRHQFGFFPRDRWMSICREVGFEPELRRVVHSDGDPAGAELFLCHKP